ncbi:MAG: 50S ribosomal protein L11 methyltransferase [Bacillota bacterium]|jgi:ribosomal protein L11 methyltransferase|nr:50S ribosomal protein L11 methyltransferase [Bacillota bacterium]HHT89693.1 50S ribosomal protein L11 methyltransferase [Bacillota bacterium]
MSNWQEVKIVINRGAAEGAYAILSNWGIETYAVDDSALINHAREMGWGDYFPDRDPSEQITITCYFPEQRLTADDLARLGRDLEELQDFGFSPGPVLVQAGEIQEADWAHAWKAFYRPLRVGRVWIQPSWESLPDEVSPTDLVVQLDPGMAFGSGTHPTTAMCVQILQDLNLSGRLVWDVGTGSGILAIVAAKLGAQVQAVDIDPVAVRVALENRDRNHLSFPIRQGSLGDLEGSPEVIVANIVAEVIAPMLPEVWDVLAPKGFFIAAGVIDRKDPEILSLAKDAGFSLLRRVQRGEWMGYLFQRRD